MLIHSLVMHYIATNSVLVNIFARNISSKPYITTFAVSLLEGDFPTLVLADFAIPKTQKFDYPYIGRSPLFETSFLGKKVRLIFDKIR